MTDPTTECDGIFPGAPCGATWWHARHPITEPATREPAIRQEDWDNVADISDLRRVDPDAPSEAIRAMRETRHRLEAATDAMRGHTLDAARSQPLSAEETLRDILGRMHVGNRHPADLDWLARNGLHTLDVAVQQERIRAGLVRGHSDDDEFCHCPDCVSYMAEESPNA